MLKLCEQRHEFLDYCIKFHLLCKTDIFEESLLYDMLSFCFSIALSVLIFMVRGEFHQVCFAIS